VVKTVKILSAIAFLLGAAAILLPSGFSQDASESIPVITVSGEISAIDVANNTISVKYISDEEMATAAETVLSVTEGTVIDKNATQASISDLAVGDEVNASYISGVDGKNIAGTIVVAVMVPDVVAEPTPEEMIMPEGEVNPEVTK